MDAIERPFEIIIINPQEVRMGSPYSHCRIELVGLHNITLPIEWWQDKYAWSPDFKKLVLLKWNFEKNEPSFHLFKIDVESGHYTESPRIFGLPNSIVIQDGKIKINKFFYDKEKSEPGKLCCNIDEEFEL